MTDVVLERVATDLDAIEQFDASSLLRFAFETYGDRAAIGTSLQKTGIVILDLVHKLDIPYRVFFIDTLMNNPETYDLLAEVEERYGVSVERFAPTDKEVEALYHEWGQYAHFLARTRCCHARKTLPMQRALLSLDAWVAGLRADQSDLRRKEARKVSWVPDPTGRKVLKLNPLCDWTEAQVDEYTQRHNLPYNRLYDYVSPYGERYTVIGCQTCHIPVQPQREPRTGKFPWESGQKECGLHFDGGGI